MTIWVDADAAPRAVKEILVRASQNRDINVVFVANRWLPKPKAKRVTVVTVSSGADIADEYIVEQCKHTDLVITADIPLAARVVEKQATVITPYGKLLDNANVHEHLSMRDFKDDLRSAGIDTGGPPPYSQSQRQQFANALDRWITQNA